MGKYHPPLGQSGIHRIILDKITEIIQAELIPEDFLNDGILPHIDISFDSKIEQIIKYQMPFEPIFDNWIKKELNEKEFPHIFISNKVREIIHSSTKPFLKENVENEMLDLPLDNFFDQLHSLNQRRIDAAAFLENNLIKELEAFIRNNSISNVAFLILFHIIPFATGVFSYRGQSSFIEQISKLFNDMANEYQPETRIGNPSSILSYLESDNMPCFENLESFIQKLMEKIYLYHPDLIKIFQFSDDSFMIHINPQNDIKMISEYLSKMSQNKTLALGDLPHVITISIRRFSDQNKSAIKNFSEITIENYINVTFIDEKETITRNYELFGVVIHNGIYEQSGYYVAFLNINGIWYEINNFHSFIVSEQRVHHFSNFNYYRISMLFYIDSKDQIGWQKDATLLQIDNPEDIELIKFFGGQ